MLKDDATITEIKYHKCNRVLMNVIILLYVTYSYTLNEIMSIGTKKPSLSVLATETHTYKYNSYVYK